MNTPVDPAALIANLPRALPGEWNELVVSVITNAAWIAAGCTCTRRGEPLDDGMPVYTADMNCPLHPVFCASMDRDIRHGHPIVLIHGEPRCEQCRENLLGQVDEATVRPIPYLPPAVGYSYPPGYERVAKLGRILADLNRCVHGRHQVDACFSCPDGRSAGNPHLPEPGAVVGYDLYGRVYRVPQRGKSFADPEQWQKPRCGDPNYCRCDNGCDIP